MAQYHMYLSTLLYIYIQLHDHLKLQYSPCLSGKGAHSINLERATAGSTSTCVAKGGFYPELLTKASLFFDKIPKYIHYKWIETSPVLRVW